MEGIVGMLLSYEVKLGLYGTALLLLLVVGVVGLRYKLQRNQVPSVSLQTESALDRWYRKWRRLILGFGFSGYIGVASAMIYGIYGVLTPTARVRSYSPQSQIFSYNQEILVEFDVPVVVGKLRVHSFPEINFTVVSEPSILGSEYSRRFRLMPAHSYPVGETILLYLSDTKNPLSSDFGSEHLLELTTASAVSVIKSDPAVDATDVAADVQLVFYLSAEERWGNHWSVVSEPAHQMTVVQSGNEVRVRPEVPFQQGIAYAVRLYRTPVVVDTSTNAKSIAGVDEEMYTTRFTTRKPPLVASISPVGTTVTPQSDIRIQFEEPIDVVSATSAIRLAPSFTDPPVRWNEGNTQATVLAGTLQKDTAYTITIGKGVKTVQGGELTNDIEYTFRTLGPVKVVAASPEEHQPASVETTVSLQFDQDVDKRDAESKFFIRPSVSGSFEWYGNQMQFIPKDRLSFGQLYTFGVSEAVRSINGLASSVPYQFSFATSPEEFVLEVPFFKQEESFTCNIAASRQLLAHRGVSLSEMELKNAVGTHGRRGNGDPQLGYVAEYGTYWEAVSAGVKKYRPTRVYLDWNLTSLLDEVRKGNPVMIWGQNGWSDPHEISWTNSDGKRIYAVNGMHSSVVRGYRGSVENPTHIIINDPWRGVYGIETAEFMRRWSFFKVGMIVD